MLMMASSKKGPYFKGILWSSGANIVSMCASLLTIMIAARILSKDDLGAYFLVMVIVQIALVLGNVGFRNAAIRFLTHHADEDDARSTLSRYLLTINIIFSMILSITLAIVLPFLVKLWPSNSFSEVVWYSVLITFLINNRQMGLSVLAGHNLFGSMSIIITVIEIFRMGISIYLLYIGLGVSSLLISMSISNAIGLGFAWYALPISYMKPLFRHGQAKEIFYFGGWMYGASLASVINVKTAEAILTTYLGTVALATYSTAMQVPSMLQRIFESVKPVILGYVSSLQLETFQSSIVTVRLLSVLLSSCAAVLIVIAQPLMVFIFSSKYQESIPIMQLLSTWVSIGIVNYYLTIIMIGKGRTKQVFFMSIFQLITMIGSAVLLVPYYQGKGAAISLIITSVVGYFFGSWLVSERSLKIFFGLILIFFRSSLLSIALVSYIVFEGLDIRETIFFSMFTILCFFLLRVVTISDLKLIMNRLLN